MSLTSGHDIVRIGFTTIPTHEIACQLHFDASIGGSHAGAHADETNAGFIVRLIRVAT